MTRRRCIVPSCKYIKKQNDADKRAMFKVPKDEEKALMWASNIPGMTQPLTTYQYLCERHFESRFIHRYQERNTGIFRSRLDTRAVPTIFEQCQSTLVYNEFNDQNRHKARQQLIHNSPSVPSSDTSSLEISSAFLDSSSSNHTTSNETSLQDIVKDLSLSEKLLMNIKQEMFSTSEDVFKQENSEDAVKTEADVDLPELTAYENLHKNFSFYVTQLPENWNLIRLPLGTDEVFVFSKECTLAENNALIVINEKSIVLDKNGDVHYSIHGKRLGISTPYTPDRLNDIDTLLDVISKFGDAKVCQGICTTEFEVDKDFVVYKDDLSISRHVSCSLIADKQQCDACWEYSQYLIALMINNTPVLGNQTACFYNNQIYS